MRDSAERRPTFRWTLSGTRGAVASLPMAFWVATLVIVSTISRFLLARGVPGPFIFQDELLYSELGKSLGTTGHFALRGAPGLFGLSPVYPVLISPAYALFESVTHAYTAVKLINALAMSLSAIPAYLVARRLVSPGLALLAAALVLAVPDLLLAGTVMTENAFYPIFLLWFLVLVRMLERPTIVNQVAALALLLLAYETRPQALVLAPALLTALAVVVLTDVLIGPQPRPTWLQGVRAYWLTLVLFGVGALLYGVVQIGIRGRPLKESLLKTYVSLANVHYTFGGVAKWFLYLVGEIDIVAGVLPLAALVFLVAAAFRKRESSRALRAFVASAASAFVWLTVAVAAFSSSPYVQRLEERNAFYVLPLLLIALVVWSARFAGRDPRASGIAATVAVAFTSLVPLATFFNGDALTDAFGILGVWRLQMHFAVPFGWVTPIIVLIAIGAGIFFVLVPARFAVVAPATVLLLLAVENRGADLFITQASADSRKGAIRVPVDWVDHAVGPHGRVSMFFTNARPPSATWQNEFFNRSVGPLYNFAAHPLDGLPQQMTTADRRTGLVKVVGDGVVRARYVLTDTSQVVAGTPVASDPGIGMRLYRVDGPVRLIAALGGIYADSWSGSTASFFAFGCRGGKLGLVLAGEPRLHPGPVTVIATSDGRQLARLKVPPGLAGRRYTIPLRSTGGACQVDFAVSPTAVPAETVGGQDTRALGIRFMRFTVKP